jgi:chromosome partitioning protein
MEQASVGLAELSKMAADGKAFLSNAVKSQRKPLDRLWSPGDAAKLVGRDRSTLIRVEKELGLTIERNPLTNYRLGYSFENIQAFRWHTGTLPFRGEADPVLIIALENFKGGTGKSTIAVNFAVHTAVTTGMNILVADMDSQGTASAFFQITPDLDLQLQDTVADYLMGNQTSLDYAIRDTQWPNIKVIPGCLPLGTLEVGGIAYVLNQSAQDGRAFFHELRAGLDTVKKKFDLIVLDVPPSQGIISTMSAITADALIVPTTAKMPDVASTVQFFSMLVEYLEKVDPQKTWRFVKVLVNQYSLKGKVSADVMTTQEELLKALKKLWPNVVFEKVMHESNEIHGNAVSFNTPYEQPEPNRRVLRQMEEVFDQILTDMYRCWPSKADELRARGIV